MVKTDEGWVFVHDGREYGPYSTKQEADEDRRGLERFEKYKDRRDYVTVDPKR